MHALEPKQKNTYISVPVGGSSYTNLGGSVKTIRTILQWPQQATQTYWFRKKQNLSLHKECC